MLRRHIRETFTNEPRFYQAYRQYLLFSPGPARKSTIGISVHLRFAMPANKKRGTFFG